MKQKPINYFGKYSVKHSLSSRRPLSSRRRPGPISSISLYSKWVPAFAGMTLVNRICTYFVTLIIITLGITNCSLAPTYHRPAMDIQPTYKETGKWLKASPKGSVERGDWWKMYADPTLNALEEQVTLANENIQAALARYEQAKAEVTVARSALYPNILGVLNANRFQSSSTVANPLPSKLNNDVLATADLTYEVDVWGRVYNTVKAANSRERASAADLATVALSLHAELANYYFSLRSADEAIRILDETVIVYQKALYLTRQRYRGGAAPIMDVDQAKTQLESAKTLAANMRLNRAQFEHAIAILIGKTPADFSLFAVRKMRFRQVTVAPSLPSTLLERRPDIASAELQVQAANALIGVSRAAFFPAINLSSAMGYESRAFSSLLKKPSMVWSLGPSAYNAIFNSSSMPLLTQTIFDGGRLFGLNQEAWAHYAETVAQYRQTVLTAFQEVEDNLAALRQLDKENKTQSSATRSANRASQQAMYRYKGGLTTYLSVVYLQTVALQNELSLIDIHNRRQIASVQLIRALGGGWEPLCI